jgi:hypothetical protein
LFILLGALVTIDSLRQFFWDIVLLVAALVLLLRSITSSRTPGGEDTIIGLVGASTDAEQH